MLRRDIFKVAAAGVAGFFLPQKLKADDDNQVIKIGSSIRVRVTQNGHSHQDLPLTEVFQMDGIVVNLNKFVSIDKLDVTKVSLMRLETGTYYVMQKVGGQWWFWYNYRPEKAKCSVEVLSQKQEVTATC